MSNRNVFANAAFLTEAAAKWCHAPTWSSVARRSGEREVLGGL
jgi:hypothetical protein